LLIYDEFVFYLLYMFWASRFASPFGLRSRRAIRSITFGRFTPFGGSAAIPLAQCPKTPIDTMFFTRFFWVFFSPKLGRLALGYLRPNGLIFTEN